MGKTATLQVLHAFCVHFFAVTAVHDYDVNKRRRNFLSHIMNIDINPRNSAPGEVASI